jgi:molybdopterin converting factor small subunit
MPTVHLPPSLRELADGRGDISLSGRSVRELVADLEAKHPGLSTRVRDEQGNLRPHVKIFLNGEQVGLDDTVQEGDELRILPAISGG